MRKELSMDIDIYLQIDSEIIICVNLGIYFNPGTPGGRYKTRKKKVSLTIKISAGKSEK